MSLHNDFIHHTKSAILVFSLLSFNLVAQPSIEWQKSFGGSGPDEPYSIQQTNDGKYIVSGLTISYDGDVSGNHGIHDYWVIELNDAGQIQWEHSLGGDNTDWPRASQVTNDGGCIIAGLTESDNGDVTGFHGDKDAWIVKLSSTGVIQWQKTLGGSKWDEAWDVKRTQDGGYVVAGRTNSSDGDVTSNYAESMDCWVVKLDSIGNVKWQKSLGGNDTDAAYGIQQTTDEGFIVVGESSSLDGDVTDNHGSSDCWIVKLNAIGVVEWQKSLGSSSIDRADDVCPTNDGGYIVVGIVSGNDGDVMDHHGLYDIWVVKLNYLGEIEWQKALGGSELEFTQSIQQTNDGGYIITGQTQSTDGDVLDNDGGADIWVIKLTVAGEIQWQKTLGGTNAEWGGYIQQTSDGGFVLTGRSSSNNGDASANHGGSDFWVVKLSPETVGIEENPTQTGQLDTFPNPSTSKIFINTKVEAPFNISISDLLGREISRQSISREESIDLSTLANGLYILTAIDSTGQFLVSKFRKQE